MTIARCELRGITGLLTVVLLAWSGADLDGQSTKIPSTLRYGSGIIDVPVASVLPHMAITGTYSGFPVSVSPEAVVNSAGDVVRFDGEFDKWLSDASVAIGLFDRVELGATVQNFSDSNSGGTMVGGFGRLAIIQPEQQGLGLAVGGQFVTAPSFDGIPGVDFEPSRLGHPDTRLRSEYDASGGKEEVNTSFTPYVVATAALRGFDSDFFPEHDFTFSVGWGDGTFRDGGDLAWYQFADSNGWFAGAALHLMFGNNTLLNLMGEWNGFDVNVGAQFDFGGFRIGGFILGLNYEQEVTTYRSKKFGVLGSVALCPNVGGLCKAQLIARPVPDTIQLPAPPPDTVVVREEVVPPLPTGTPTQICLATGATETVVITAQGDTLVGPQRINIRDLRPGVVFAGSYAAGLDWFENDADITYERRSYSKSGGEVRLDCANIRQIGFYQGVPLFADNSATTPYQTLYVPVRPGVWQAYQTLRATRG